MKKRVLAILMACLLLVSVLAACGGDGDNPGSNTNSSGSNTNSPGGNTSSPGGNNGPVEITLGSAMAWENLTPFRTNRVWSILYSRMLYDTLAFYTADGVLNPMVAKSWEVEGDGVTWNVEIYDYVTDSQNNHITADDIVWFINESMTRALKPAFNQVASVEKTGEYTLKIVMKEDLAGSFNQVLMSTFVVSKAAFESDPDEFNNKVISSAAYSVTNFVSGSSISFEKRADYWQKEELIPAGMKNNVDKLTVKYISEASQMQIALETGEVDGFIAITQSLLAAFDDSFSIVKIPSLAGTCIRFSGDENKLVAKDENLRKAIAYAIDEKAIIQGVYAGYADKMSGPESKGSVGFQASWDVEANYSYDVEKAKDYLAKSNYNGETLEIIASSSAANDRLCTMIQSYLGEIGIDLKLNIVERSLYTASQVDGSQWDLQIISNGGVDLASSWIQSYDMNSYPSGDAASRKDATLTQMIHNSSTTAGFTSENINAVHDYLMEHLYDYGLCQAHQCDVYRADLGITQESYLFGGTLDFVSCVYGG